MADIAIKMGVNAPGSDVDEVLKVLDYIYQQDPSDDDKPAFSVVVLPLSRKLIRVIYEQRNREGNEEERSRYVQQKAEEFGLQ